MNCFVCISSKEYIPFYSILFKSLQKHSPETKQILYHIGNVQESFDEKVNITSWYNEAKYSSPLEKICSLRARVVLDAFEKGYTKVVFSGADMEFYSNPDYIFNSLDTHNVFVTPHITEPLPEDGKFPSNASISSTGHLNTDLVAFNNHPSIIKFLSWQNEIMKTQCINNEYIFLDQSWLNFLPFFVDNVDVCKDPGFNYAYWKLYNNYIVKGTLSDSYIVKNINGSSTPLVCVQYSGITLDNPSSISVHQNRWIASGAFLELLNSYTKRIKELR